MNREEVVIITKCGVTWDQEMKGDLFNKVNGIQLYKNLNSESVKKEIVGSLERLGTDYVDVYMTHWQSVEGSEYYVPIQKTMDVLNELKAQGKIRAIGAANVDIDQIKEYLKWGDLDIVQAKYSILDRGIEDEIIPCCREPGSRRHPPPTYPNLCVLSLPSLCIFYSILLQTLSSASVSFDGLPSIFPCPPCFLPFLYLFHRYSHHFYLIITPLSWFLQDLYSLKT